MEEIICLRHGNWDATDAVKKSQINTILHCKVSKAVFCPTGSSEALLSGQKPPFRLLCRATSKATGARLSTSNSLSQSPLWCAHAAATVLIIYLQRPFTIVDTLHSPLIFC